MKEGCLHNSTNEYAKEHFNGQIVRRTDDRLNQAGTCVYSGMNIAELIARHLLDVYAGQNWTEVNLQSTLEDLNYHEASRITPASANTIAGLVHHLAFWNGVMYQRIQGTMVEITETNGFDNRALADDEAWQNLKQVCFASAKELAGAISKLTAAEIQEPILAGYPTAYKSLQGCVEHVHYHLGQIVILKQLVRANNASL